MPSFVAVTDTCVLFPMTLCDILLRTAAAGLYRLCWSEQILDELARNLQEERGLAPEKVEHRLTEMRRAFPEATVSGYELFVGDMTNHPKDRHVLATAVHSGAHVIVTSNLKDFPGEALDPYHIEAQDPDEFLGNLLDLNSHRVARIVIELNLARQKPPERLSTTLIRLEKSAPRFVAQVKAHPLIIKRLQGEEGEAGALRVEAEG